MKVVTPISDGKYLAKPEMQAPSKELIEATGLPLPLMPQSKSEAVQNT